MDASAASATAVLVALEAALFPVPPPRERHPPPAEPGAPSRPGQKLHLIEIPEPADASSTGASTSSTRVPASPAIGRETRQRRRTRPARRRSTDGLGGSGGPPASSAWSADARRAPENDAGRRRAQRKWPDANRGASGAGRANVRRPPHTRTALTSDRVPARSSSFPGRPYPSRAR